MQGAEHVLYYILRSSFAGVKILWLMWHIVGVFFSLLWDHRNSSKYRQRQASMFISSLEVVRITKFYCQWFRRKNTKSLDVGHIHIHVHLCFPFWCSLSPGAHFSFLNLSHALILPADLWWLELFWHHSVHPCCLVQYKLPMSFFLTKGDGWLIL